MLFTTKLDICLCFFISSNSVLYSAEENPHYMFCDHQKVITNECLAIDLFVTTDQISKETPSGSNIDST